MSLRVDTVSYTYGSGTGYAVAALKSVSLTLEPGRLTLVVGGTGSGKSTLLRACAGLLEPDVGSVEIDGVPAGSPQTRGHVGLVFQSPEAQFFAETVLADVSFGPRNLGRDDPDAEAAEALAALGLDPAEYGSRSPFTLSGGEARRAAIAGVLSMRPAYLLLDEPTAGLDGFGRAAVSDAVARARRDAGVLIVTHDVEEFLSQADEVIVLRDGEITFAGTPERLLASPDSFEGAGTRLPEVARAQLEAGMRIGLAGGPLTLDPYEAAERILAAWRAAS